MKLLTYDTGTGPRCGVLQDGDSIVDVTALLGKPRTLRDVGALLALDDAAVDRVGEALAGGKAAPAVALGAVRLRSPVLQPPTVRDFIVYEEHASSQGTRQPHEVWYRMPVFYFSNPLCIYGPHDTVPYPSTSTQFDYEMEIGAVIGRGGSDIVPADALSHIAGFCIFNDWSARDVQFDEMAFGLGPAKGKDTATTLGPWLVTTDEMAPYIRDGRLTVKCQVTVNGEPWLIDGDARGRLLHLGRNHPAGLQRQPHRPRRRNRQRHRRRRLGPRSHPQRLRSRPIPRAGRHRRAGGRRHRRPKQHARRENPRLVLPLLPQTPHRSPRPRHPSRLPLRTTPRIAQAGRRQ